MPPKSVGGNVLLLTCATCNSRAGTEVDAELHKSVRHADFARGVVREPLRVQLSNPALPELAAQFASTPTGLQLMFIPQASRKGAAEQWSAAIIESTLRGGALDAKATTRAKVRPFGARVSLLRAAYLAAFAKFGYTYALRPELELVRQQIVHNKTMVLPYFSASGSASPGPPPEPALATLKDGPNAVVAVFAHQLVFCPGTVAPTTSTAT